MSDGPGGLGSRAEPTRRVFLALPLAAAARDELATWYAGLGADPTVLRPVDPTCYHITVHFFGSLEEDDLARARGLSRHPAWAVTAPLRCRLTGLEQLPPRGPARVLHAALAEGGAATTAFLSQARALVAAARFPVAARDPFPHVTVARVRRGKRWRRSLANRWLGAPFVLDLLVLYESHLSRTGARYEPLETQRLGPG